MSEEEFNLSDYVSEGTVGGVATCQVALSGGPYDGQVLENIECGLDGEPLVDQLEMDRGAVQYAFPPGGARDEGNRRIYVYVGAPTATNQILLQGGSHDGETPSLECDPETGDILASEYVVGSERYVATIDRDEWGRPVFVCDMAENEA